MRHQLAFTAFSCLILTWVCDGFNTVCPRTDGYFSNPLDCNEFLHCENGRALIKKCPVGYHFNSRDSTCDVPTNARCLNMCTKNGYFPHPTNCAEFYQCDFLGKAFRKVCPLTLHFNPSLQVCDFPYRAGCTANSK